MNRFLILFMAVLLLMPIGMVLAQSADPGYPGASEEQLEYGEGYIESMSEEMIVINDTGLFFPNDLNPKAENGSLLSRSSLHVGDKVAYWATADRFLVFLGKFNNQ